ncbi:MAG: restriction endonuclease subunit S [Verrucomicrobiales bacterium]|nr:restriction endonuclease subunit S [Verrucomicrobiales bacterium]
MLKEEIPLTHMPADNKPTSAGKAETSFEETFWENTYKLRGSVDALAPDTTQQGCLDHPTLSDPQSLFPAAFEFTEELDWIPEVWEVSTIDDECEIVGGGTPSTNNPDFWDGGEFPWGSPKDFSALQDKLLLSSSKLLTQAGLDKASSGLLPKETVLMPSRAPVGNLVISKIETAINQGFIGMICNKRLSPEFILQWAYSRMDDIKRAADVSTFSEISKKAFRNRHSTPSDKSCLHGDNWRDLRHDCRWCVGVTIPHETPRHTPSETHLRRPLRSILHWLK